MTIVHFFDRMSAEDSELLILSPLALSGSNDQGDKSYSLFRDRKIPTLEEENVDTLNTAHGQVRVAREGNPTGPAFVTFHDMGLNHLSNYKVITFQNSVINSQMYFFL